jgi:MFS family permease
VPRAPNDRLIRQPGYPRLFTAATVARLSNEMFPVAGVLYVLDRTGSAAIAGAAAAALAVPTIVSGPVLGAVLDRARRRARVIAIEQAVGALALAALLLAAGHAPGWVLPLLMLPAGIAFPLSTGGFTSLLRPIVPDRLLLRANALEASSFNLAIIAGPALAGTIALAASPRVALLVELVLKGIALPLAASIRDPAARRRASERTVLATTAEGLKLLVRSRELGSVTAAAGTAMVGRGLLTLGFPLFAAGALDAERGAAGYLWAAYAAGSTAGALLYGRVRPRVAPAVAVIASIGASGALMCVWPLAGTLAPALAIVALAGLAYGPGFAATFAVRQQAAPDDLQGQVFLTAASVKNAGLGIGSAVAGAAAGLGGSGLLLAAALMHVGACLGGLALLRPRRSADRREAAPA